MVHKKYTYKDGKRFGPYLYENKRVNGKVVTTYLGSAESKYSSKKKSLQFIGIIVGIFAVLLLLFFVFQNGFFSSLIGTGKVSLDIKSSYKAGEKLEGAVKFNLKEGELVPKNAKVIISLGKEMREFNLNELVSEGAVYGNYFAEGAGISGEGDGYGIAGEKVSYPEVSFSLEIFEKGTEEGGVGARKIEEEDMGPENESIVNETLTNETITNEIISNETAAVNESLSEANESAGEQDKGIVEINESIGDNKKKEEKQDENGIGVITGEAINENSYIINGKASRNNSFSYPIDKKEDAKLISGSVKANAGTIEDNVVSLKIKDGMAEVSTDYSIIEKGFGERYLGKKGLSLEIDFGKFDFNVNESGELNVKLIYNEESLAEIKEDIFVESEGEIKEKANESEAIINGTELNITIANETALNITINETIINATIINKTAINLTIANVSVDTTQYGAVLDKPVKWKKVVISDKAVNMSIELPSIATNVSIVRIVKGNESEEAIEAEEINIGLSGNVISGKISAELELNKEPKIVRFFNFV